MANAIVANRHRGPQEQQGSQLFAVPRLSSVNAEQATKIVDSQRKVYKVEKTADDFADRTISTIVLLVGGGILLAVGLHSGLLGVGVGIAVLAYGTYQLGNTIHRVATRSNLLQVTDKAAKHALDEELAGAELDELPRGDQRVYDRRENRPLFGNFRQDRQENVRPLFPRRHFVGA